MVLHQDVYRKAQAELDRVVGPGRLPDFEDREHLPYLECVLKEVFRCVMRASWYPQRLFMPPIRHPLDVPLQMERTCPAG